MNGQYRNKMERNKTLLLVALGLAAGAGVVIYRRKVGTVSSDNDIQSALNAGKVVVLTTAPNVYAAAQEARRAAQKEGVPRDRVKVLRTTEAAAPLLWYGELSTPSTTSGRYAFIIIDPAEQVEEIDSDGEPTGNYSSVVSRAAFNENRNHYIAAVKSYLLRYKND